MALLLHLAPQKSTKLTWITALLPARYRQAQAPELFLGAFLPERELVGYICSTLSSASTLTHHSMETHEPGATTVCVHSVCVSSAHRGRGLGGALVREYLARLAAAAASGASIAVYAVRTP